MSDIEDLFEAYQRCNQPNEFERLDDLIKLWNLNAFFLLDRILDDRFGLHIVSLYSWELFDLSCSILLSNSDCSVIKIMERLFLQISRMTYLLFLYSRHAVNLLSLFRMFTTERVVFVCCRKVGLIWRRN